METNKTKSFAYWLEVAAIGVVLGLVIQGARAWTEPSEAPPGGNVGAPINTEGVAQRKEAPLWINTLKWTITDPLKLVDNGGLFVGGKVQADDFCLSSDKTKCLGGGGSQVDGGLYGWCSIGDSGYCGSAVAPAFCSSAATSCECPSGYKKVILGENYTFTSTSTNTGAYIPDGDGTIAATVDIWVPKRILTSYSCLKGNFPSLPAPPEPQRNPRP